MLFRNLLAAFAAFLIAIAPVAAQVAAEAPEVAVPTLRLPAGIRPLAYDLTLSIVPGADEASGEIAIDVELDQTERVVWLHADGVRVRDAKLAGSDRKVTLLPRGTRLGLGFDPPLAAGRHRVKLAFASPQSRGDAHGLFAVRQADAWYAMTQFEPISARRAFPCFDEPAFKVPWTITLVVPRELVALANTPAVATEEAPDGMKRVRFATTRPLPSYLVAFAVGPWALVDAGAVGVRSTPTRFVAPKGRERETAFVRSTYPELFDRIERWFGIAYAYPKLDHIAIPLDVGFAMENAGLITYAERLFLSPATRPPARFQRAAVGTGAHEITHQWFGNLVTAQWWDDIWLNEAFTTWFTSKIVGLYRPDWKRGARPATERAYAMEHDALPSARRIREPIVTEGDIRNAFDGITYQKGATVIAMFERWIGEDVFREAVQRYIEAHRDGNATVDDFLRALEATSRRPVGKAFSTFLDQAGFPVVALSLDCSKARPELALSQRAYVPLGSRGTPPRQWDVPVCVTYGDAKDTRQACVLLDDAATRLPLAGACPAFVMGNAGGTNYYLPDYRGDLLARLREHRGALSTSEEVSVVLDLRAQIGSGALPVADALPWIEAAAGDRERAVVDAAIDVAEWIGATVAGPESRSAYDAFVLRTFGPRMRALGLVRRNDETEDDELLRAALLRLAGHLDPATVREANRLARAWMDDPSAIDRGFVEPVLLVAAHSGDAALFDALLAKALAPADPSQRRNALIALFSFDDPALARRGEMLLLDERFDVRTLNGAHLDSLRKGLPRPYAQEFLAQHFDALAKRVTRDQPAGWPWFARGLCSDVARAEVAALWRERAPRYPGAERNLAQVLDGIGTCTAVRKAQQPSLAAYLART